MARLKWDGNSDALKAVGGTMMEQYGGFHKWRYPQKWIVYNGIIWNISLNMDYTWGVPPFMETPIWNIMEHDFPICSNI